MYSCTYCGSIILGLNFLFLCFWVWKYNCDNEFETKANKIQTKDTIEPQQIKYAKLNLTFLLKFECTTNGTPIRRFLEQRPWEQVWTKEITLPILIQSSISSLVGGGLGQEGMQTLGSTITTWKIQSNKKVTYACQLNYTTMSHAGGKKSQF